MRSGAGGEPLYGLAWPGLARPASARLGSAGQARAGPRSAVPAAGAVAGPGVRGAPSHCWAAAGECGLGQPHATARREKLPARQRSAALRAAAVWFPPWCQAPGTGWLQELAPRERKLGFVSAAARVVACFSAGSLGCLTWKALHKPGKRGCGGYGSILQRGEMCIPVPFPAECSWQRQLLVPGQGSGKRQGCAQGGWSTLPWSLGALALPSQQQEKGEAAELWIWKAQAP